MPCEAEKDGSGTLRCVGVLKHATLSTLLILACCYLVGCRSYVLSYPYPWEYSKQKPKDSDMVGTYKVLKLRLPSTAMFSGKDAQIILRTDGTAMFSSVPGFDELGQRFVCTFSGSATWNLDDKIIDQGGWSVAFKNYQPATTPTARECDLRKSMIGFLVLSRHPPYRLYQIVGDRDSDTGVEYQRTDAAHGEG